MDASRSRNIDESPIVFKIRKGYGETGFSAAAYAVVIITDKPQKPLPLNWDDLNGTKAAEPAMAGMLF
jgi:hypothetical protein